MNVCLSSWRTVLRTMAFVLRFIHNCKVKLPDRSLSVLSSEELLASENCVFRQVQYDCFKEEILIVRWNGTTTPDKHKEFDKTSIIRDASPYLDEFGVLRVASRLDNANFLSDSAKRPIILARHHYVTHLLVDWYHLKYHHRHHQTVLNEIKQKFSIPKLRMVLNTIRNNCQHCKNTAA